jgi:hypothetical protein
MLPDRKTWFDNFINTDRYKHIVNQLDDYPELKVLPGWNGINTWQDTDARHILYMRRVISLSSIYPIDYIHNQTNGGLITNITERPNYFAGMYNVQLPNGSKLFSNTDPIDFVDLQQMYRHKFDNVLSVCSILNFSLTKIDYIINNFSRMINCNSDGRYGYISLNPCRMFFITTESDVQRYQLDKYYKLVDFIDGQVEDATDQVEVLYYENLFENHSHDDPVDGTIRLFFRVKP